MKKVRALSAFTAAIITSIFLISSCLAQDGVDYSDVFSGGHPQTGETFGSITPDGRTGELGFGLGGHFSEIAAKMEQARQKAEKEQADKAAQEERNKQTAGDDQAADPEATKLIAELMGNDPTGTKMANRANNNADKVPDAAAKATSKGDGGGPGGLDLSNVYGKPKDPKPSDGSDLIGDGADTSGNPPSNPQPGWTQQRQGNSDGVVKF